MAQDYTILIGTVGQGLGVSNDAGETWTKIRQPIPSEATVRTIGVYPDNPHRVLAGSDVGIFRSDDNGGNWEKIDSPMDDLQIWSVAIDPTNSETIFAGTKPFDETSSLAAEVRLEKQLEEPFALEEEEGEDESAQENSLAAELECPARMNQGLPTARQNGSAELFLSRCVLGRLCGPAHRRLPTPCQPGKSLAPPPTGSFEHTPERSCWRNPVIRPMAVAVRTVYFG